MTRTCYRKQRCLHPSGPTLPESEFAIPNRSRLYTRCSVCRDDLRQRKTAGTIAKKCRRSPASVAPDSVRHIDPDYQAALHAWLRGLVIRREDSPLTRDIV